MSSIIKPVLGSQLSYGHRLARGLVGCWLMNEGAGSKVYDLSGNGGVGTLVATAHWAAGKFGHALDFDGDSDYVTIPAPVGSALDIPTTHTISQWIYARASTSDVTLQRFQWNNGTGEDLLFWLYDATTFRYSLTGGSDVSGRVSGTFPGVNVGFHAVGTYDGVTARLYINGIQAGSVVITEVAVSNSEPWLIATDSDASGGGSLGNWVNGLIDNTMIWGRCLSASEVALLYTNPFCMFEREPVELWVGSVGAAPPVGMAGAMTTNTGYWGW